MPNANGPILEWKIAMDEWRMNSYSGAKTFEQQHHEYVNHHTEGLFLVYFISSEVILAQIKRNG